MGNPVHITIPKEGNKMKNINDRLNLLGYTSFHIALLWVKTAFALIGIWACIIGNKTSGRIERWLEGEQEGLITRIDAKIARMDAK